jgi:Spy/CpxP family protein refolding chaperone
MNQRKTILLTLLGLTAVSGLLIAAADVATAPSAPPPLAAPAAAPADSAQKVRDAIHDRIVEQLGLTADQQKQIDGLKAKQKAELEALKADTTLAPEQRREQARTVMQGYREQMRTVLTPDQQKKAAELREHFARQMEKHGFVQRGERRPAPRPAMGPGANPMAIVAMGERIKDRMAEQLQLTDEQRDKLEHLGRAFRAQQRELTKKHMDEMRAVLTPEQQEKAKRLMHHFRAGGPQGHRFGDADEPRMGPPDGREFAGPDFGPGAPAEETDDL